RDAEVRLRFKDARDRDYRELIQDARRVLSAVPQRPLSAKVQIRFDSDLRRLRRRLEDIITLDFFGGHNRQAAELALGSLEQRLRPARNGDTRASTGVLRPEDYRGRTWVTRRDIHVDRM